MNGNFLGWGCGWILLGGVLVMGSGVALGDWPGPPEDIQEHVIAVDGKDSAAEVVRLDMHQVLGVTQPQRSNEVRELATKDRGYVLSGNLFGTGGFFALYEPKISNKPGSPTLALAEHVAGKMELRGLWKTRMDWIPQHERWSGPEYQYEEKDSLHVPFLLEDVIGDATPEVIVAGEKGKYHQARYVMMYNKESHGLDLLTYSWAKPVKVGNYLRIYDISGNKAIWQAWTFLEWKDGQLAERAMWHSESPYNNIDPPFKVVRVTGADGKLEKFRVAAGNSEADSPWNYEITKNGEPFAKLAVEWTPGNHRENAELMEAAWIFEKLTGLAREDFPQRYGPEKEDKPKLERLEDHATVVVEAAAGNEEARDRFSGKK